MTTTKNNEHKKLNVPNKQEQNQTCLDSAEREGLRPKGNVPNLRFPEFQREWEKCRLGEVCTFLSGGTPKIDVKEYWNGTIPFVSAISMHDTYILDSKLHISEEGLKHGSRLLTKNNLLLLVRGSMLWNTIPICLNKNDVAFNQDVKGIIANDTINNEFLLYWLKSKEQRLKYMVTGTGLGAGKLDTSDLLSMIVYIPAMKEQDKVARLLSLFDERIATQSKIIDKLQSLIKGIMVELQKQGVNKGTWKTVFLSDVLTERNERNTNLFQVFSVSVSQGVVNQVDYLGRSFAAKDTSKYNVVHYGDLVYTKSPTGSFPYGIVKQSLNLEIVAVSPLYGVYKPKSLAVGAYLHEYFMSEINTHNYLHPLIQKGAKNTINITNQRFLENCVLLPTNINELLQISKLLRSLNNKIKYQQDILQQYQKQKQYLLRQMFI